LTAIATGTKRGLRFEQFSSRDLPGTASTEFPQGAVVGWDTATGLLINQGASTTFRAIGTVVESKTLGAGGGNISVKLFREVTAIWMENGPDAVVATDRGGLAYGLDNKTVNRDDNTNTLSVMGVVWALDTRWGVLVEPLMSSADNPALSGLD
jgi:hypothetical protein